MKKILSVLAVMCLAAGFAGCSKCAPGKLKEMVSSAPKEVTMEDIGKSLAPLICEKYSTCNKSPDFNKDQCLQEISTGVTENLKNAKDLKVTQDLLDACKKAIQDSPCEALNSPTPPTGCEFLQ